MRDVDREGGGGLKTPGSMEDYRNISCVTVAESTEVVSGLVFKEELMFRGLPKCFT